MDALINILKTILEVLSGLLANFGIDISAVIPSGEAE